MSASGWVPRNRVQATLRVRVRVLASARCSDVTTVVPASIDLTATPPTCHYLTRFSGHSVSLLFSFRLAGLPRLSPGHYPGSSGRLEFSSKNSLWRRQLLRMTRPSNIHLILRLYCSLIPILSLAPACSLHPRVYGVIVPPPGRGRNRVMPLPDTTMRYRFTCMPRGVCVCVCGLSRGTRDCDGGLDTPSMLCGGAAGAGVRRYPLARVETSHTIGYTHAK